MHLVRLLAAVALALALIIAGRPAAAIEAGKDYKVLSPAQPTENKNKIEVVEFFYYYCPHCFEFEPLLNDWARNLPKDVVFRRQPVIFAENWEPMARAYYALDALGVVGKLHHAVFDAVQVQDVSLNDPEVFFDWAAKQGVDKAKLKSAYDSFAVGAKVSRAKQVASNFKLNGVPALAVNGRYLTSASMSGGHEQALETVDQLIEQERARNRKKGK